MVHGNVWYRSAPKRNRWRPIWAHEDSGVLGVSPGKLTFRGKRGDVVIEEPRVLSVGLSGMDTINPWITVADRNGTTALFADGSRFGWGGVRGGTARLASEIEKASGSQRT